jgi:PAS domain S-box-containing protein
MNKILKSDNSINANEAKVNHAEDLVIALEEELVTAYEDKAERADELVTLNKEKAILDTDLITANKKLANLNLEKGKRAKELIIANKELTYQNSEKAKRVEELIIANKEKKKRADELIIANKELVFQNSEKDKRAKELIIANEELAFQNSEKEKRAEELITANKRLLLAISEEKRANDKYTQLYDFAPAGFFIISKEGKIVDLNLSGAEMVGIERNHQNDKMFYSFVSEDTKTIFNLFFEQIFQSHTNESCEVTLIIDKSLPIDVHLLGIALGNRKQCLINVVDMSKNKKIENIINKNIGAWEFSLHDGSAWQSLKHAQIFGYEKVPSTWTFELLIEHVIPDDRAFVKEKVSKSIATGNDFTFECRIRRKDGIISWIRVSGNPIFNKQREPVMMSGIVYDINEHKQAELELIKAKEKAEENDRLKSSFLSNMSHEIRTPMNGILGFTELLKEPNLTIDEQKEFIQIIQISGARMLNTINNIVDISKIESGLINIDIKESNINEKMEFTYKFFKPEVESKGLQLLLKNSLPSTESIIKTDNEKVYAVLTNLVKNAIKFTRKGFIEFGYEKKGNYLEFFVKDTGIGINKYQQDIIFERFRQGSESYERGYEGSGLGLSIAKSYVEMLDGKIWLVSEEGKGSTFYFTIPYNAVAEEKSTIKNAVIEKANEVQIKNLKILIVEDDEVSYSLLTRMLQNISKDVIHEITGVNAIEACRNNPDLDLVLMDIRMPQMDGNEATRQIRQFNKDVIIIAQTAYAFSGDYEKAIEAGCNDYISKPIDKTILYELIKKHVFKTRINTNKIYQL